MPTKSPPQPRDVRNDPRLLFWFAIILMLAMFVWSFFLTPSLHQPAYFIPFTGLFAVHIFIHWQFPRAARHPRWLAGYTLVQGILAFGVTYLSGNVGMVFCLFMALIGELLAIYHVTVRGILAAVYFLVLAFANFVLRVGLQQAGWFALGTIPTIIFVAIYVILYTRQAQANARAQELLADLEAANRQLSEYAARVEDLTIAAERQRMARELHDTLSQGLAGLILQLEAVDAHLAGGRAGRARDILQGTMERARAALTDARRAIDDLRRSAPPDLKAAAREEVDRFTAATGIPCTAGIDLTAEVPETISEVALRAIAESLTNIARHARAHSASLRLVAVEDALEVEVCDDGIGFDPALVEAGHYGLLGMRERVRLAGGSFEVHSGTGRGTRIKIRFPLEKAAHA
jgi:NarL family two-component system sensor histidine kinase YdfH